MIYLCNGLSESMKRDPNMKSVPFALYEQEFIDILKNTDFVSVIGHQLLADYLTKVCGMDIEFNRRAIQVNYDDYLLLVSMNGRLPEHPKVVDYEGRLNYSFVRFEKQNTKDFAITLSEINKIKGVI